MQKFKEKIKRSQSLKTNYKKLKKKLVSYEKI